MGQVSYNAGVTRKDRTEHNLRCIRSTLLLILIAVAFISGIVWLLSRQPASGRKMHYAGPGVNLGIAFKDPLAAHDYLEMIEISPGLSPAELDPFGQQVRIPLDTQVELKQETTYSGIWLVQILNGTLAGESLYIPKSWLED